MKLTDAQHALLAEKMADKMLKDMDIKTMERMIYDMYLDDFLMMDPEDLQVEADMIDVEVPSALAV